MSEETTSQAITTQKPRQLQGRNIENIKIYCSKHGNISEGSVYLQYSVSQDETKTVVNHTNIMCLGCLGEIYSKLQQTQKVDTIISYKKDAEGKLILDENGDPIRIVTEKPLYLKDAQGNLLLDTEGNPVPEKVVGDVSVNVVYQDTENKPAKEEEKTTE